MFFILLTEISLWPIYRKRKQLSNQERGGVYCTATWQPLPRL